MESAPSETVGQPTAPQTEFTDRFDAIAPLILEEWPHLTAEELAATEGRLEAVIDYIALRTEHTRTLIRHHLAELAQIQRLRDKNQSDESDFSNPEKYQLENYIFPTFDRALKTLEKRTENLIDRFEAELLPEANRKAKEHVGTSLLTALGIGFILGLLLGGSGRGR
jgi:ElaB/YqjD/DUF883 family membrane-anchored ribosome-binding protein